MSVSRTILAMGSNTMSIYALVECMRCTRARIDILAVFGISILFLLDVELTFDW